MQHNDYLESLATLVSSKLEDGDFTGAVRLVCLEDSIAPHDDWIFEALNQKHPTSLPDAMIPFPLEGSAGVMVSEREPFQAIKSFPNSSAEGPDGLKPCDLKNIIHSSASVESQALLFAMAYFIKLFLQDKTPLFVCTLFLGTICLH